MLSGVAAAGEGDRYESDYAEKDEQEGLHAEDEVGECGGIDAECLGSGFGGKGRGVDGEPEYNGYLPGANAAVGWYAHCD